MPSAGSCQPPPSEAPYGLIGGGGGAIHSPQCSAAGYVDRTLFGQVTAREPAAHQLRDSDDAIEREGVRRAADRADRADLRLLVLEPGDWPDVPTDLRALAADGNAMVLLNKVDLGGLGGVSLDGADLDGAAVRPLSAKTGEGVDAFLADLTARVRGLALAGAGAAPAPTRARHRHALEEARASLEAALAGWSDRGSELTAEELRLAARAIGRITGRVDVEDLLDVIFSDFCIGK